MGAWTLDATAVELVADAGILGAAMLVATLLRRYVPLLQRYLIPNALVAGAIGLVLGPELIDLVPISIERMGSYVYHLLALTFICVGLRSTPGKRSFAAFHLGFMQIMCMLLQAMIGLSIMLLIYFLVDASVSPAAGMLLTLGFGMGPGVAYSIGDSWSAFGFEEGGAVGLSLAAIGFLIAYVVGVAIVHRHGLANGSALPRSVRTGVRTSEERTVAGHLTLSPAAIEPLAFHLAMVAAIYGVTYLVVSGLAMGLESVGLAQEAPIVWSFHFILANLLALIARRILTAAGGSSVLDDGLLDRLTGVMADYLIAASIMAISLGIAWRYALPIMLMAVLGTLVTYWALAFTSKRIFREYRFERFIGIFGEMTGTVTSGLALIRILDPEYKSPVAQDLVLASGIALALGFPLLVLINLPFTAFGGRIEGFFVLFGLLAAYFLLIMLAWRIYYSRSSGA
ncbi:MAG: ESS family glutamate:Na+ symporter [Rhodothermales bacterium]|jgi:ESS family glutamate:Na+ symporter